MTTETLAPSRRPVAWPAAPITLTYRQRLIVSDLMDTAYGLASAALVLGHMTPEQRASMQALRAEFVILQHEIAAGAAWLG